MNGRQAAIPGTERRVIEAVTAAAEAYIAVRDQRMELTQQEVETKATLMEAMKAAGLTHYVDEDARLEASIVVSEETVKVKRLPRPQDGDEG